MRSTFQRVEVLEAWGFVLIPQDRRLTLMRGCRVVNSKAGWDITTPRPAKPISVARRRPREHAKQGRQLRALCARRASRVETCLHFSAANTVTFNVTPAGVGA
jgi:hypothetical protein